MFTKIKGYRTLLVSAITALLGLLTATGIIDVPATEAGVSVETLVDNLFGAILVVVAAINAVLRLFTDTKVGTKN